MNIQTFIVGFLFVSILIVSLLIVLVFAVGMLRLIIASVFEFDFVEAYKKRKGGKNES